MTGDHMDVQLRHHITEGADVHLVGGKQAVQSGGGGAGLVHQQMLVGGRQMKHFADAWASGYQDQPGIGGVVHQQDAAQRPTRHLDRVSGQTLVQEKVHYPPVTLICRPMDGRASRPMMKS